MLIAEKFVGTVLMFVGFLNVLLSLSGEYEINMVPFVLYFAGMAIWAHAVIENLTVRYTVMGMAIVLGLAFFHYGDVHMWHKVALFNVTILTVVYFMLGWWSVAPIGALISGYWFGLTVSFVVFVVLMIVSFSIWKLNTASTQPRNPP